MGYLAILHTGAPPPPKMVGVTWVITGYMTHGMWLIPKAGTNKKWRNNPYQALHAPRPPPTSLWAKPGLLSCYMVL